MFAKQLFKQLGLTSAVFNDLTPQIRYFSRSRFPNEVAHYLHRAKLIDSIRLCLRSDHSTSLFDLLNTPSLDSFVVANALRAAPSPDSALFLIETLREIPYFSHTQTTLVALAKVLANARKISDLKTLIRDINGGKFTNAHVSFMDLMRWYATAKDLESVLETWDEYRSSNKNVCTESYNIVMDLYVKMGKDVEGVETFKRLIEEGAIPNCRTYTIIIEHLVRSRKLDSAIEVFNLLPLMRIKRTLRQYSVLVEEFVKAERFDTVKMMVNEMRKDGILPGRAMQFSLQQMRGAGFVEETDEFMEEMLPDERIKNIKYEIGSDKEEEDDGVGEYADVNEIHLKPWLDPRALASALRKWGSEEVTALEEAKFVWTSRLVCKVLRNFKSPETAWEFFCWVANQLNFTHDKYTIQRMTTLAARHGHVELVDKLISLSRTEGIKLPFTTLRLIIEFYGHSKIADAALRIFRDARTLCGQISKFNLMILYTSLLRSLTKCDRKSDVLDTLEDMILNGIYPDIQTYSGLMQFFAVQDDIKTVQRLFTMVRQSGINPDAYMFKVLIKAYCKCERAALAWRVFEEMRDSELWPDGETKRMLVTSLWKEGKRREAAAVEESCEGCEEIKFVLPLALRGHVWTVNSSDLTRVCSIYSELKT